MGCRLTTEGPFVLPKHLHSYLNAPNAPQQDTPKPTPGTTRRTDLCRRNLDFQQVWILWVGNFRDPRDILHHPRERVFERGDVKGYLRALLTNVWVS